MIGKQSRFVPVLGALVWLTSASPVSAQWMPFRGFFGGPCGPCGQVCQPTTFTPAGCGSGACGVTPVAYANPCACAPAMVAQPVTETVMQQVPVTEYRQVRQTVRKPVIQTSYVDQPGTEYRQIVEQKTVSVPTCSYQNVTEYQTVQRNCGQWVTKWHANQKVSPCAYDNRPGLMGEMNRIGFATRQAFTPTQYATREYVNQTVAQQVPVTRRVAIQGTKQVTYNVPRTVAVQTTRKVAVNTMKYVDEEVVVMQPVTIVKSIPTTRTSYRFVPAGSALALAPANTNTALRPTPESELPKTKSATRESEKTPSTKPSDTSRGAVDAFDEATPSRATNDSVPASTVRFVAAKTPSAARVSGWRPTRTASVEKIPLPTLTISVAENVR
ncbi:hypothetical protein LBMAG52_25660 [Planctomycetia bacterium]|nr:hypothetical protein LBMAG52_25660 [Planctomycetia bacterium]